MSGRTLWLILALIVVLGGTANANADEVRALWVTRWDFKSSEDVVRIMRNSAGAGFTDILFQVRGNGTTFYPSRVEAWGWELTSETPSTTGKDPGWDPLAVAVRAAKDAGIRIHAYVNVFPGWRGIVDPPTSARQLWIAHRDWFMVDLTGKRMRPTSKWYSFLNPNHPEVQRHLATLFREIAAYELDGIHLDYFRYPYDYGTVVKEHYPKATPAGLKKHADFSYDKISLKAFRDTYGKTPDAFPAGWDNFRRDGVTRTLYSIERAMGEKRDRMILSSAVLADLSRARYSAFQDSAEWVRRGALDWVLPMNYSAKTYDNNLSSFAQAIGPKKTKSALVVGISSEHKKGNTVKREVDILVRQVEAARRAGCRGHALFAYSTFFPNHKPNAKVKAFSKRLYGR